MHETVPIMPLAPMLMFAILFGLSMDYEVFLLSRVREQYLKHREPKRAVVEGVGSTARVITSAALIMISVFGAFILDPDVVAKMFGVGLAVAVLLDVTLVRMVLVPAAMSLLGHRAWWLPAWLDRLLPTIDLEGSDDDSDLDAELAEPSARRRARVRARLALPRPGAAGRALAGRTRAPPPPRSPHLKELRDVQHRLPRPRSRGRHLERPGDRSRPHPRTASPPSSTAPAARPPSRSPVRVRPVAA